MHIFVRIPLGRFIHEQFVYVPTCLQLSGPAKLQTIRYVDKVYHLPPNASRWPKVDEVSGCDDFSRGPGISIICDELCGAMEFMTDQMLRVETVGVGYARPST